MSFQLPKITVEENTEKFVIFFSCDLKYYNLYGIPLIKSIIHQNGWVGVHCHLILKDTNNFDRYPNNRVSYSTEFVDDNFFDTINFTNAGFHPGKFDAVLDAEKTYYACSRFMHIDKIFPTPYKRILQVDCDTLLFKNFPKLDFEQATDYVRAMRKPKSPEKIIASCLSLGKGEDGLAFRKRLAKEMTETFSKEAYWFVDQVVLQNIFNKMQFEPLPLHWNHWSFKKRNSYFRTAKGNKKTTNDVFKNELEKWTNM